MSELPTPVDQCWMMFFRNGLEPDGQWFAWEQTARGTRSACIRDAIKAQRYAGLTTRDEYARLRRRGVVRCARATIYAKLPEPTP